MIARGKGGEEFIANGFRGLLCQIRGDWEFLANVLHLANWANKVLMCPFCRAGNFRDGLEWTDFRENAPWRRTVRSHRSFIEERIAAGDPIQFLFLLFWDLL